MPLRKRSKQEKYVNTGNEIVDDSTFDQACRHQETTDREKSVYCYCTDPSGTLKNLLQWVLNTWEGLGHKAMPIKNGPSEQYPYKGEVIVATAVVCAQ